MNNVAKAPKRADQLIVLRIAPLFGRAREFPAPAIQAVARLFVVQGRPFPDNAPTDIHDVVAVFPHSGVSGWCKPDRWSPLLSRATRAVAYLLPPYCPCCEARITTLIFLMLFGVAWIKFITGDITDSRFDASQSRKYFPPEAG